MARLPASYMNLKDPKAPSADDEEVFLQAQGGADALPSLVQAPLPTNSTLTNPVTMGSPHVDTPVNKSSDTLTNQSASKTKNYADANQWDQLISQAGSSAPIAAEQDAINQQRAQAQDYAQKMAGRDTHDYSAFGALADNLNQINGQQTNYASALEKLAAQNDPKKIQDEILKNFADVTKAQNGVGTNTLKAVNDMATGENTNKAIEAQMKGLQAFNPGMIDSRNERMFQTAKDKLLNDKQLTKLGGYIQSLGTGTNLLQSNQMPNTISELQNIKNAVAGAGTGLTGTERNEMGINNLGIDIDKALNYLTGPHPVEGGLNNPNVQKLIETIRNEHNALLQYYTNRGDTIVNNNPTLYAKNPLYEPTMRNTWGGMKKSIGFTPQATAVENGTSSGVEGVPPSQTILDHAAIDAEIARRKAGK